MPRINIYEHSETYSFQTKNNSYATVAFPIAAIWGPTFVEGDEDANPDWVHFSAGFRGTTDFVSTFRGANKYLGAREKSYDYALKLLASGYDILVKRVDGLGEKSHNSLYVVPIGSTEPTPAADTLMLYPDMMTTPTAASYKNIPYRFYIPRDTLVGGRIVWDWGMPDPDSTLRYKVFLAVYDPVTNRYKTVHGSIPNQFKISAKSTTAIDTKKPLIVAFGKPEVLTTQIKPTNSTVIVGNKPERGKKVTVSGTVQVSVFASDGTVLERRNITITETSTYVPGMAAMNGTITVDSVLAPDFTYIQLESIPALLSLKAVSDNSISNIYSSTSDDSDLGLFTVRLGSAWTDRPSGNHDILYAEGVAASIPSTTQLIRFQAKFPGSFGNNLKVRIKCGLNSDGFKIGTVEVFDNNGYNNNPNEIVPTDQLLEIVSVAFDEDAATDNRPLITEATFSNLDSPSFIVYSSGANISPSEYPTGVQVTSLIYGTDYATTLPDGEEITVDDVKAIVAERFPTDSQFYDYINRIATKYATDEPDALVRLYNQQIMYSRFYKTVDELTDPIVYDWDALVQGIADDQYVPQSFLEANGDKSANPFYMEYEVSTLVTKMIEVAANSKCGAALIGTPFGMPRGIQTGTGSSAVKTGALKYKDSVSQAVGPTYSTFGEVVGPWCKTTLALSGANSWIAPEIAHLLLIINAKGVGGQNKWWMVPAGMLGTGVVHTPEYKIKRHYLDLIQNHDEGVCLNPLMEVPGKGFTCFGNSTLWDKPLGSYNALQNLSTRFLTNRVKQRIWDTALQILFRYNNEDAYSHFYAGLSPLLDEMRAVGALTGNEYNPWGYRIIMNPDIINLDRINANTVIGRVELAVTGVIDTVDVDLFLLPPTGFQETYD